MNETGTITATFVKQITEGYQGDARLYKLSAPIEYGYDYEAEKPEGTTDHVIVSANTVMFSGPETYIFPVDEEGHVINWSEMDGSFKGGLDHGQAIHNAGWILA